jgi:hypothetical protein
VSRNEGAAKDTEKTVSVPFVYSETSTAHSKGGVRDFAISCEGNGKAVLLPEYKTALNSFNDVSYTD